MMSHNNFDLYEDIFKPTKFFLEEIHISRSAIPFQDVKVQLEKHRL